MPLVHNLSYGGMRPEDSGTALMVDLWNEKIAYIFNSPTAGNKKFWQYLDPSMWALIGTHTQPYENDDKEFEI